jgi:formate dehydrogenase subunit gamma
MVFPAMVLSSNIPHIPIPGGLQGKSCYECHLDQEGKIQNHFKYSVEKAFSSYQESQHGRLRRLGDGRAPYCNDCHESSSWSKILPMSDRRSMVHPDNIGKTCARCHGNSVLNSRIAEGSMHIPFNDRKIFTSGRENISFLPGKTSKDSAYVVGGVDLLMLVYWGFSFLAFSVLAIMFIYVFFDFIKRWKTRHEHRQQLKESPKSVKRFGMSFIVQHAILFTSVFVAIVTGIPVKFPDNAVSQLIVDIVGVGELRHLLHVGAGFVMVVLGLGHFITHLFFVKPIFWKREMFPQIKDIGNFIHHNLYNLGIKKEMPKMGRYTWYEKLDYLGATWGIGVMGVTGLAMFYMEELVQYIPLSIIQMFWVAHGEEAMLATLFLLVVHMYHAHFNPWKFPGSKTWIDGKVTEHEKETEHPLEK